MFPTCRKAHLNKPVRGLSAYDEVMVEELRLHGVDVEHIITTIRTDMKASPATRSVAVKLRFNGKVDVDINFLEVWIDSVPFHSGSIMNPFLDRTRPSKVMHACGFLIGEDSTLEEVFSSLIDELEFRFKEV